MKVGEPDGKATVTQTFAVNPGDSLQVTTQFGGSGSGGCGLGAGGGGGGAWVTGPGVSFEVRGGDGGSAWWQGRLPCQACGGPGGNSDITISW